MALGELISEGRGKLTVNRVLPSEVFPKIETSFQGREKTLGVEGTNTGTFTAVMRPTGVIFGEGQGVFMSDEGEAISWRGQGVGIPKAGGAVSYRGAIYFQTASQKLARLNNIAGVFEYEVDGSGNYTVKIWEWK